MDIDLILNEFVLKNYKEVHNLGYQLLRRYDPEKRVIIATICSDKEISEERKDFLEKKVLQGSFKNFPVKVEYEVICKICTH